MIYVCVPARDEARTLGPLLWKVRKVLGGFGREFRIVVFDDASTDDTAEVLERYQGVLPMEVLRSERPVGYGEAVERLLRHVVEVAPYPKRDAAIVLQGDFSENPDFIVDLVRTLEGGADIVASSVSRPTKEEQPSPRVWGHRLAPWVLGGTWKRAPVEDPVSGFRAYRVIVLKKALRNSDAPLTGSPEPWRASIQLLHRLLPYARRIEDTPIRLRYPLPARESRFRAARVLKELWRERGRRWPALEEPKKGGGQGSGESRGKGGSKAASKDVETAASREERAPKSEGRRAESGDRSRGGRARGRGRSGGEGRPDGGGEGRVRPEPEAPRTENPSATGDAPTESSGDRPNSSRRRGGRRRGGRGRGRGRGGSSEGGAPKDGGGQKEGGAPKPEAPSGEPRTRPTTGDSGETA